MRKNHIHSDSDSAKQNSLTQQQRWHFLLVALVIAALFDQLVWQKSLGLQFLIFVLLILVGGLVLVLMERVHIPWQSYLLLVPVLFTAFMTTIRMEGFTILTNVMVSLLALGLLAITLLNGQWLVFRLREHLLGYFHLVLSLYTAPVRWLVLTFR
jgi:hypothetical protein